MICVAQLVHPALSYKLVGILYKVYNELGGGYQEKVYQAAVKKELIKNRLGYIEQVGVDLLYNEAKIHRYRLDFVIEHKIVLELKVTPRFSPRDIMQVLGYLKRSGLELGILVNMNRGGIFFKRILKGKTK